jgi:hypothetical protein
MKLMPAIVDRCGWDDANRHLENQHFIFQQFLEKKRIYQSSASFYLRFLGIFYFS